MAASHVVRLSEFSRAAADYQKRSAILCVTPLVLALLCIVLYAPFQRRFEAFLIGRVNPTLADVLVVLPMGLPVLLAWVYLIPLSRKIERSSGIFCPHCSKQLAGFKPIIIASKNCPHCGRRVIDDDASTV